MLATRTILVPVLLASVGICGCNEPFTWEAQEFESTFDSREGVWTVRHTLWNVGAESLSVRSEAFDSLLADWRTEDTLVLERTAWAQGDSLCMRYLERTSSLPAELSESDDSMHIEFTYVDTLPDIIETNGTVVSDGDGVVVRWPAGAKEIRIKWWCDRSVVPFTEEQRARIIQATPVRSTGHAR